MFVTACEAFDDLLLCIWSWISLTYCVCLVLILIETCGYINWSLKKISCLMELKLGIMFVERLLRLVFTHLCYLDYIEFLTCYSGQRLLVGYKRGSGILCTCCNEEVHLILCLNKLYVSQFSKVLAINISHTQMSRSAPHSLKFMLVGEREESREYYVLLVF